ncbi:uncharacterized protein BX663DRAFT_511374 [Cokeromyces recurvatus]|uniref:uncharacterized protein n=1 Tax=Cokeromyces recurvatus TaxID=90255 RepID=UPI0022204DB6|nr:uncharacterized protein BX663DRAFT_511374 [Cokeromyces recurvatus]KAI7902528.1 hypothetical protein BX663DRAFT_511374 [Cokeromyces recurvatus]
MNINNNERTPLIRSSKSSTDSNYKRTYHVYGMAFGFLFLFSYFINYYRNVLPTPLSDAQAKALDDFPGMHAYDEYLSHFTAPHSANTRENAVMRDWIASVALDLQKVAIERGLKMDVIADDPSIDIIKHDWFTPNEQWYVKSRNVIVRLHGQSGKEDALLINAHYDSVPTSYGVTDNGMGVVTTLELLRYFIDNPPRHTIIFLLNNFEEGGLIGAKAFLNHPWYRSVKLFINLEGAGAGGRAIMFRCSNLDAVRNLANSPATFKHGSPLGNDMFKAQLIKSDTDYSVFTEQGVPGLDIAFYTPRSHYHTPLDDLNHTTPEALQYMGQMALGATRSIANSDTLLYTSKEQESFIYFDILGRTVFVYSFVTYQLMNILALLSIPIIAFYLISKNKDNRETISSIIKRKTSLIIQGLAAIIAAIVLALIFGAIAVFLMTKINPSMTYGDVYGAALYTFVAAFLGIQVSQLILPVKFKQLLANTNAIWYGLISFWWILVVAASFAGSKGIASLYFVFYILLFNSLAALTHFLLPPTQKIRSALIFFTQTIVPFIFLLELEFLVMDAMRHSTADGTPEIVVYILLGIPLILIALHYIPWIYVAGNQRKTTMATAIVFLFLFTVCSSLQPFNTTWSPNKLVFKQEYNSGDALSTVFISTATAIHSILKNTLPPYEYQTLQCEPFKRYLTRCSYQTGLLPKYASNSTLNEFSLSEIRKTCNDTVCLSSGSFTSKNSLMCRIHFDYDESQATVQHAWINGREIKDNNISALISYVNDYEKPVDFAIEHHSTLSIKAMFGCFYDEWTQLEIPAFTNLRDSLPENAILLIRGQGLAYAHYTNITL